MAETSCLSSGVVISAGWPHLAGAHPTGKWKSGEPGEEGLGSSKVIGKGSPADLEPWSQEGHSGGLWLPKARATPGFHQGGGVCFGCNSQIMGLRLVPSGCGRWELMGFPQPWAPGHWQASGPVTVSWWARCCPLSLPVPRGRPLLWHFHALRLQPWFKPQTFIGGIHHSSSAASGPGRLSPDSWVEGKRDETEMVLKKANVY